MTGRAPAAALKNAKNVRMVIPVGALKWTNGKEKGQPVGAHSVFRTPLRPIAD